MKNNISIDELFRNGLAEGREQLNLGAWANMERMLDGKNPYEKQDDKRKRRIVPLFWLLFLLTGTASTAVYYMQTSGSKQSALAQSTNPQAKSTHVIATNQSKDDITASSINLSTSTNSSESAITSVVSSNASANPSSSNAAIQTTVTSNNYTSKPTRKASLKPSEVKPSEEATLDMLVNDNEKKLSSKSMVDVQEHSILKEQSNTEIGKAEVRSTEPKSKRVRATRNNKQDQDQLAIVQSTSKAAPLENTTLAANQVVETIPTVVRQETVQPKSNGTSSVSYDTIDQSLTTRIRQLQPPPPNPRAVALNAEQEANAQKRMDPDMALRELPENSSSQPIAASTDPDVRVKSKEENKKNNSLGGKIQVATQAIGGGIALAAQKIASKRPIIYPALTAGVNMATSQQNYGGFQVGLSNLTQLSDYFTILADLKLFYRFNSGYSVRDYQTTFKNISSIDSTSLASTNQNIYSYQMDSTVRKYNFNSMWSVEVPISLQYHLRKLSFYTGVNLAFNPGLNTNTVIASHVSNRTDTLSKNFNFIPESNKPYEYVTEDFRARWGLGYMFGASYAFNPRLYVDLRFTQTVWDNSKTLSSRAISDNVYRVPYLQFSLGYRFKDFNPER